MKEIILSNHNNQIVATSVQVSQDFEKRHDHVLRDIDNFKKDVPNFGEMFFETELPDSYNRFRRAYLMNRDGFVLLVMGFTGKKAVEWQLKYINAFNKMEEMLKSDDRLTLQQKARLMLFSKNANEVVQGNQILEQLAREEAYSEVREKEVKPLTKTIEIQQPLVDFAETVQSSEDTVTMEEYSKTVHKELNLGKNKMYAKLRKYKVLRNNKKENNLPYQSFIDRGYFEIEELTRYNSFTEKEIIQFKTKITPKGQIWLLKKLREILEQEKAEK